LTSTLQRHVGIELSFKAVVVLGYYGGLRCDEITNMRWQFVRVNPEGICVEYNQASKGDQAGVGFKFNIIRTNEPGCPVDSRRYKSALPRDLSVDRFFKQYRKGKWVNQPMGKNAIGSVARHVAIYLGKPNPDDYTGHCWRRTFGTSYANSGASMPELQRAGRWKSATVAAGYVDTSETARIKTAQALLPKLKRARVNDENLPPAKEQKKEGAAGTAKKESTEAGTAGHEYLAFHGCSVSITMNVQ